MPRVTRSTAVKLPENPTVADKPLAKSKPASRKRAIDDLGNKGGENASSILPQAKRVALSPGTVASKRRAFEHVKIAGSPTFNNINIGQNSQPVQRLDSSIPRLEAQAQPVLKAPGVFWDVEGQYTLKSSSHSKVDTAKFHLNIYYFRHCSPCQLYGEFEFGDLKGIMRLCPLTAKEDSTNCTTSEFSTFCDLDTETKPGSRNPTWIMNWRGIDGGMRQNRKLGGTPAERKKTELYFVHRPTSSTPDFTAIDIEFCMIYGGEEFIFNASKKANLEKVFAKPPWLVKEQWDELRYNPYEHNMVSQPRSYTAFAPAAAPAAANSTSKPPTPLTTNPEFIETPPADSWDITGEWRILAPQLAQILGLPRTTEMTWTIKMDNQKYKHNIRQLWARFSLGEKFKGTIRLCPPTQRPEALKKFEACCILRRGHWPSREQNKWLMRWRGAVDSQIKKGADGYQTQVEFGNNGRLTMQGTMVYDCIPLLLSGYKLRDVTRQEVEDSRSLLPCWEEDR